MRNILKGNILKQKRRTFVTVLLSGTMVILCCGCNNPKSDITKEDVCQTTDIEVSSSMETVFVDSRYVSGNRIDEFIEDKSVKELVVTNKFSENEESIIQTIQREEEKYVLDGKTYSYFYKLTYHGNKTNSEVYILADIIMDEKAYEEYLSSSLHRAEGLVVVATNIL